MAISHIKTARPNKFLVGALGGGALGALYGLGDTNHNYKNEVGHNSTVSRGAQGALSGIAGAGGYAVMRGLGKNPFASGLAALLSASGAAALTNPKLRPEDPYRLPF